MRILNPEVDDVANVYMAAVILNEWQPHADVAVDVNLVLYCGGPQRRSRRLHLGKSACYPVILPDRNTSRVISEAED
jgi:hypothetical protein